MGVMKTPPRLIKVVTPAIRAALQNIGGIIQSSERQLRLHGRRRATRIIKRTPAPANDRITMGRGRLHPKRGGCKVHLPRRPVATLR